jgi:hypothetical protein
MNKSARWTLGILAAAVLVFGLLCLNYTKPSNLERHAAVAKEKGLPSPSANIHHMGMGLTALAGIALGFAIGRRTPSRPQTK